MAPVITRLITKVMTEDDSDEGGLGPRCNRRGND